MATAICHQHWSCRTVTICRCLHAVAAHLHGRGPALPSFLGSLDNNIHQFLVIDGYIWSRRHKVETRLLAPASNFRQQESPERAISWSYCTNQKGTASLVGILAWTLESSVGIGAFICCNTVSEALIVQIIMVAGEQIRTSGNMRTNAR